MLEPAVVLPLLVFLSPVGAPELLAGQGPERDGFGYLDEVSGLDGVDEVGVERPGGVRDGDVLVPLAALPDDLEGPLEALLVAEDVDVFGHGLLQVCPDFGVVGAVALEHVGDAGPLGFDGVFDDSVGFDHVAVGGDVAARVDGTGVDRRVETRFVLAAGGGTGRHLGGAEVRAGGVSARPGPEDDEFRQGVAAQPVRAVDGRTRTLAGGVQPAHAGFAVLVGLDAAHVVVLAGLDRHRLLDGVDALEVLREVDDVLEAVVDALLAEVPHVEVDVLVFDAAALGEERIYDRLENIIHLAEDFEGVDPVEKPMPVKPGQHYHMGGIETNEHGETCVSGLYAAGECACASVHGSNRLGGNALPELIVFGARAGRHAAGTDLGTAEVPTGPSARSEDESDLDTPVDPGAIDTTGDVAADGAMVEPDAVVEHAVETERTRIEDMLERDGTNHAEIRADLQAAMTENVNVFRNKEGLQTALEVIRECRERYQDVAVSDPSRTFNTDLIHTIETRNLIDIAESITLGALARTEFRGAHWRQEHQERKDDGWLKHTMIAWNDGTPDLYYKPVVLEGENEEYEPKERSY